MTDHAFQIVKAVASVSAGLPANPVNGQLVWDTNGGGALKIYLSSTNNWQACLNYLFNK